jgi:hypothetical protein
MPPNRSIPPQLNLNLSQPVITSRDCFGRFFSEVDDHYSQKNSRMASSIPPFGYTGPRRFLSEIAHVIPLHYSSNFAGRNTVFRFTFHGTAPINFNRSSC